jgi:hypothetical protein
MWSETRKLRVQCRRARGLLTTTLHWSIRSGGRGEVRHRNLVCRGWCLHACRVVALCWVGVAMTFVPMHSSSSKIYLFITQDLILILSPSFLVLIPLHFKACKARFRNNVKKSTCTTATSSLTTIDFYCNLEFRSNIVRKKPKELQKFI